MFIFCLFVLIFDVGSFFLMCSYFFQKNCYYHGEVQAHPDSDVTLSVCSGLRWETQESVCIHAASQSCPLRAICHCRVCIYLSLSAQRPIVLKPLKGAVRKMVCDSQEREKMSHKCLRSHRHPVNIYFHSCSNWHLAVANGQSQPRVFFLCALILNQ